MKKKIIKLVKKIFDDERNRMNYKVRRIFAKHIQKNNHPEIKYLNKIFFRFISKIIRKCNFNSDKKPKDILSKYDYEIYNEYMKNTSKLREYIWTDHYKIRKIYDKLTEDEKIIFNKFDSKIKLKRDYEHFYTNYITIDDIINSLKKFDNISKKENEYLANYVRGRINGSPKFIRATNSDIRNEIKNVENKYSKLLEQDPKKALKKLYNYHVVSYNINHARNFPDPKVRAVQYHTFFRLSKNMHKRILKYAKKYPKDKYAKFWLHGTIIKDYSKNTQNIANLKISYPTIKIYLSKYPLIENRMMYLESENEHVPVPFNIKESRMVQFPPLSEFVMYSYEYKNKK